MRGKIGDFFESVSFFLIGVLVFGTGMVAGMVVQVLYAEPVVAPTSPPIVNAMERSVNKGAQRSREVLVKRGFIGYSTCTATFYDKFGTQHTVTSSRWGNTGP